MGFPPPTSQPLTCGSFPCCILRQNDCTDPVNTIEYPDTEPDITVLIQFHVFRGYFTWNKKHSLSASPTYSLDLPCWLPRAPHSELAGVCHFYPYMSLIGQNQVSDHRWRLVLFSGAALLLRVPCGAPLLMSCKNHSFEGYAILKLFHEKIGFHWLCSFSLIVLSTLSHSLLNRKRFYQVLPGDFVL